MPTPHRNCNRLLQVSNASASACALLRESPCQQQIERLPPMSSTGQHSLFNVRRSLPAFAQLGIKVQQARCMSEKAW